MNTQETEKKVSKKVSELLVSVKGLESLKIPLTLELKNNLVKQFKLNQNEVKELNLLEVFPTKFSDCLNQIENLYESLGSKKLNEKQFKNIVSKYDFSNSEIIKITRFAFDSKLVSMDTRSPKMDLIESDLMEQFAPSQVTKGRLEEVTTSQGKKHFVVKDSIGNKKQFWLIFQEYTSKYNKINKLDVSEDTKIEVATNTLEVQENDVNNLVEIEA